MQFLENEIRKYLEFVWSSLDMTVEPCSSEFDEISAKNPVMGSIQISGKWQGVVALCLEPDLANRIAEKMFALDKGKASGQEIEDAVSEVTNMIGGNLKALLPQPSYLSMPIVDLQGNKFDFPFTELVSKTYFQTEGSKLMVTMHQALENRLPQNQLQKKSAQAS